MNSCVICGEAFELAGDLLEHLNFSHNHGYNQSTNGSDIHDNVNHPPHYNSHPSGVECITIVEHFEFNIGNMIKYAWRAGLKGSSSKLEDLKKAAWYANRAVEKCEKENTS